MNTLLLDGNSLTLEDIRSFIEDPQTAIALDTKAVDTMKASRALVEEWIDQKRVMYGVTTGFGEFANINISSEHLEQLQRNLIMSHAAGCGEPMPRDVTRVLMLLRANALAKGYSGIRVETVETLLRMLQAGTIPVIPSQGSVGSSGDLVQLAHLVLTMIGEGMCCLPDGRSVPALQALRGAQIDPVTLTAKEGLALINGTQMMSSYLTAVMAYAHDLAKLFDIAGTMTLEALLGTDRACDPQLHAVRPHPGQQQVARNIKRLIAGSDIRESHRHNHNAVQDAYSLRCMPQVHGASRDAIRYVKEVLEREINSATDNPLLFPETGELIEGGNFHGQPIALAADFLGIALAEFANISERRIERTVNGKLSGLPRFLTDEGGLNSGMMIAQYTAASLVSENKVLAHPASVDSIPTSANQEDHNSMGSIAARKAYSIFQNVISVLAIEFLTAAQALDYHAPKKMGAGTLPAHSVIRSHIPHLDNDRVLHNDFIVMQELIRNGAVLSAVEKIVGALE